MSIAPLLRLALEPVVPSRTPAGGSPRRGFGYQLRLDGGLGLVDDDPLLAAAGAVVGWVDPDFRDDLLALQSVTFAPGQALQLVVDRDAAATHGEIGVWDVECIRRAGTLSGAVSAQARAGADHGIPLRAVALWEERSFADERRMRLKVLVYVEQLVDVAAPPEPSLRPAERATRRRLVLFALDDGELRWWDASADGRPIDVDAIPVSAGLAGALVSLRAAYRELRHHHALHPGDRQAEREELDEEARRLWLRARDELGGQYAVGFLGAGMQRPVWSADGGEEPGTTEIPF